MSATDPVSCASVAPKSFHKMIAWDGSAQNRSKNETQRTPALSAPDTLPWINCRCGESTKGREETAWLNMVLRPNYASKIRRTQAPWTLSPFHATFEHRNETAKLEHSTASMGAGVGFMGRSPSAGKELEKHYEGKMTGMVEHPDRAEVRGQCRHFPRGGFEARSLRSG